MRPRHRKGLATLFLTGSDVRSFLFLHVFFMFSLCFLLIYCNHEVKKQNKTKLSTWICVVLGTGHAVLQIKAEAKNIVKVYCSCKFYFIYLFFSSEMGFCLNCLFSNDSFFGPLNQRQSTVETIYSDVCVGSESLIFHQNFHYMYNCQFLWYALFVLSVQDYLFV